MKYKILTPKSPINSCTVTLFLYLKSKKRNQKLNPNPFQKIGQLKFKVNSYSGDNSSNPIQWRLLSINDPDRWNWPVLVWSKSKTNLYLIKKGTRSNYPDLKIKIISFLWGTLVSSKIEPCQIDAWITIKATIK